MKGTEEQNHVILEINVLDETKQTECKFLLVILFNQFAISFKFEVSFRFEICFKFEINFMFDINPKLEITL